MFENSVTSRTHKSESANVLKEVSVSASKCDEALGETKSSSTCRGAEVGWWQAKQSRPPEAREVRCVGTWDLSCALNYVWRSCAFTLWRVWIYYLRRSFSTSLFQHSPVMVVVLCTHSIRLEAHSFSRFARVHCDNSDLRSHSLRTMLHIFTVICAGARLSVFIMYCARSCHKNKESHQQCWQFGRIAEHTPLPNYEPKNLTHWNSWTLEVVQWFHARIPRLTPREDVAGESMHIEVSHKNSGWHQRDRWVSWVSRQDPHTQIRRLQNFNEYVRSYMQLPQPVMLIGGNRVDTLWIYQQTGFMNAAQQHGQAVHDRTEEAVAEAAAPTQTDRLHELFRIEQVFFNTVSNHLMEILNHMNWLA